MGENKSRVSYGLLLFGVFILYNAWPEEPTYNERSLKKLTIELSADAHNVRGRQARSVSYRLFAKEYPNAFTIVSGSIGKGKHEEILNLRKGQIVDCYISSSAYNELGLDEEDILLRGLSVAGQSLMSQEEFLSNRGEYEHQQSILFLVLGIMIILNGLFSIPDRYNFGIAVLTIIIVMTM